MLGKISLAIFVLLVSLFQNTILGSGVLAFVSFPLILTVASLLILPNPLVWWFFIIGIIYDLLSFQPIGFTPLLLLFVIAVFRALKAIFSIEDFWGNIITSIIVIIMGGVFENILFRISGNVESILNGNFVVFVLVNVLGMFLFSLVIFLILSIFNWDAEV